MSVPLAASALAGEDTRPPRRPACLGEKARARGKCGVQVLGVPHASRDSAARADSAKPPARSPRATRISPSIVRATDSEVMGLPHRRQVVLHDRDGVVPLACPEVEERDLRQRPEADPERRATARDRPPRSARSPSRSPKSPNSDAWLPSARRDSPELIESAMRYARSRSVNPPRSPMHARAVPMLVRAWAWRSRRSSSSSGRQRLPTGLDRLRIPAREHQEPRRLGVELRLGKRGPASASSVRACASRAKAWNRSGRRTSRPRREVARPLPHGRHGPRRAAARAHAGRAGTRRPAGRGCRPSPAEHRVGPAASSSGVTRAPGGRTARPTRWR